MVRCKLRPGFFITYIELYNEVTTPIDQFFIFGLGTLQPQSGSTFCYTSFVKFINPNLLVKNSTEALDS